MPSRAQLLEGVVAVANCRFCGAPIRWAKTSKGRNIPLNPTPVPDGKFGLILNGQDAPPTAVRAQDHHQLRYDTHFADCPFAGKARKR